MNSGDIYRRMSGQPLHTHVDQELDHKVKRVSDKFSETVNMVANEPSLAFFRIQEHVRKTLPQLVDTKHEVEDVQSRVQGTCFDADYAVNAVKAMQSSAIHFQNIQDLLKNAMFMKQQIAYEDNKRKQGRSSPMAGDRKLPPIATDPTVRSPLGGAAAGAGASASSPQENREDSSSSQSLANTPFLEKENLNTDDNAENKEVEELMSKMLPTTIDRSQ